VICPPASRTGVYACGLPSWKNGNAAGVELPTISAAEKVLLMLIARKLAGPGVEVVASNKYAYDELEDLRSRVGL
jgi:hypothetical protein